MMHPPHRRRLVVIGNGMAGMRTVEELLARCPAGYAITVFGDEPLVNYNRIMLSSVLAGDKSAEEIVINAHSWYEENGLTLHAGDAVLSICRKTRTVTSASGHTVPYDKLLIATGSKPLMPPLPGIELPGVVAFRQMSDVQAMLETAQTKRRAAVIGGGLLGLEAAWGLKRRGMDVAVAHLMPSLMERQLDREAAALLQRELTERGLHFFMNAQSEEILGETRAEGLLFADGRSVPADLVVVATGIRPNVALAKACGLDINRGIAVGNGMETSDPDIYAVGECVEHGGQTFGLVAPLWEQAKVCAAMLAGDATASYTTPPLSTRLKITGIDVFSAGQLATQSDDDSELVLRDSGRGVYRKLILREGRLVGAVMYGDVAESGWYFELIRNHSDISPFRDRILLGRALSHACAHDKDMEADVAALSDDTQICGCNGISKGAIAAAIKSKQLTTLNEVRAHTKASASCGQCTSAVQAILAHVTGAAAPLPETMCGCTDLSHDAVRKEILTQKLKTQEMVFSALAWRSADGCAKCRPALNYYLLCAWPGEYVDDSRSRFVNERLHANIQKDGTYSVIPRMWGGLTNPAELRAIAAAAEKHGVPAVKVTGGQRIDLLGVPKERLPAIWADLNAAGLVSGHAYGKSLRTVKTCVGSEWCRFGTQDSTGLGVKLEKMTWGSWTPHKFKMAVSGCPRNCAEASIKDFGIVCVEGGYDIMVGGNGGIEVRVTDQLTRAVSEEEVMEFCAAFLQLYREEARYLERTAPWVERMGIAYVKKRLVDDAAGRKALAGRFAHAQRYSQDDPWFERAGRGADAHEFKSLAVVE